MTPIQALQIIYQASRKLALNAEDHEKLRQAAAILEEFIVKAEVESSIPAKGPKKK